MASLKLVTAPAAEPLTLAEAKLHLRVDVTDDDSLITGLITAAREQCETFIKGCVITQTWQETLDEFPVDTSPILLRKQPLLSVTSVTWTDWNGTLTTMAAGTDYLVDNLSDPGRLVLPPNMTWPGVTLWPLNPIVVTCTAGYGPAEANVPQRLKQGMLMAIGHWYENREAVETSGAVGKEIPMATEYLWMGERFGVVERRK